MGGIEYQVKLLAESLAKQDNIEVTYLSRKTGRRHLSDGYRLLKIAHGSGIRRYGFFLDAPDLLRLLNRINPDVIYENGGCAYTGIAAYHAKRSGCQSIWHIASDNDLKGINGLSLLKPHRYIERKMLHWGIKHAKIIVAQSDAQKRIVARINPNATIHLVRNFHPDPQHNGSIEKSNQIVWVANFKPLKQPEIFITLAERLQQRNIDVRCIMVGAPAAHPEGYQHNLEARIAKAGNLDYLGVLPVSDVNRIIAGSRLLVNTSKWEGFPNTFIQSWMRKTPVISLSCDPDHVISNHQCGVVSGSLDNMVENVIALLGEHSRLKAMGENSYAYAMRHHSVSELRRLEKIILERQP
jgi:glycosyltransferase involved in cell wall biosynthesis